MKVAYLTNTYPKVSHSFIRREIAGLESHGVDVTRYSIRPADDTLRDEADIAEAKITTNVLDQGALGLISATVAMLVRRPSKCLQGLLATLKLGFQSERGVIRHLIYFAEACWLTRRFQHDQIEHVHVHFGTNPAAVALIVNTLGGPGYSFTSHGPEEYDKPLSISLGRKIEQSRFVVAITEFGRSQLSRWCRYQDWSKLHIIHCGVDDEFLRDEITPVPETNNFVCVGRLCEQKGQLKLIEAASRLAADGIDFHVTLVGDGEMRNEIESLIDKNQIRQHVTITGWASGSEVKQHLLNCRAMVLPSFAEGLPVVIMEALALGRPVISTYVAGIPELVEPGKCGYLCPAGSVDHLTEAMRSVLETDAQTLTNMGQAGAESVSKLHDAKIESAKLAKWFAQYIGKSTGNQASGNSVNLPDQQIQNDTVLSN